jgi:hypothetical protein
MSAIPNPDLIVLDRGACRRMAVDSISRHSSSSLSLVSSTISDRTYAAGPALFGGCMILRQMKTFASG